MAISAIIAVNGVAPVSFVAAFCGGALVFMPRTSSPKTSTQTPSSTNEQAIPSEPESEVIETPVVPSFRLYRQNELRRILASLLANSSILVAGEEGSGKSVLANAVMEKLKNDGFTVAYIEPTTPKQMLLQIAEQLGVETGSLEGRTYTAERLKIEIAEFFQENIAFVVIDDCQNCDARFRLWLKQLKKTRALMLLLATNPPKTDVFSNIPSMTLKQLPEYAIREIMEQAAIERGLNLKNSDLAQLQERAGGNPMLAIRAIDEEYLGLDIEAADHNRYVDSSPLILIAGVACIVLRVLGMSTHSHALYLISGIGAALCMGLSRLLYHLPKESRRIRR